MPSPIRSSKTVRLWLSAGLVALAAGFAGCPPHGAANSPEADSPRDTPFTRGPYLLRTQPGTMTVVVKADLEAPPTVEWWKAKGRKDSSRPAQTSSQPFVYENDQWMATLTDLEVPGFYGYRVTSEIGDTAPQVFKSGQPDDGVPFRFAAFGDTRTGHQVHRAVVEAVAKQDVDFLMHTGDMVDTGGLVDHWDRFFAIEQPLIGKVPIFPTVGNHDMSARGLYGDAFLMESFADGKNYYYQDWGNLRIIAVDSGIECRKGCTQNNYARGVLSEGAKRGMLMIMFLHHPPYSSGAHGSNERLQVAVGELARTYGVELVMAGHDHNYERTKPIDGTTYIVASAAGAPIRPVRPNTWTAAVRTEPHYAIIDVHSDHLAVRAINLEGEQFDEAKIADNAPRGFQPKAQVSVDPSGRPTGPGGGRTVRQPGG